MTVQLLPLQDFDGNYQIKARELSAFGIMQFVRSSPSLFTPIKLSLEYESIDLTVLNPQITGIFS